jgi:hypothetical protein
VREDVHNAAARAVMWALVSVLPFVALSIVASVFLGNVWIGKAAQAPEEGKPAMAAERGKVMYASFLPALFTGSINAYKQDLDVNLGHKDVQMEKLRNVEASGALTPLEMAHVGDRRV